MPLCVYAEAEEARKEALKEKKRTLLKELQQQMETDKAVSSPPPQTISLSLTHLLYTHVGQD